MMSDSKPVFSPVRQATWPTLVLPSLSADQPPFCGPSVANLQNCRPSPHLSLVVSLPTLWDVK